MISNNRNVHDSVAAQYDVTHREIFNSVEQCRIATQLTAIKNKLSKPFPTALDFGCGSGNITAHLVTAGFVVTSADVSPRFLDIVQSRHGNTGRCRTEVLSGEMGEDLVGLRFDLICIYSVLHHIPDYISVLKGLAERLNPGGYIYIDHEASDAYWNAVPEYAMLQKACKWRRLAKKLPDIFSAKWITGKFRMMFDARYQPEGDIHVWPDDHIEWALIRQELKRFDLSEIYSEDYLCYREYYGHELFDSYRSRVSNMHCSVFKKG
jgi:SAM-dependent methyltransferase